MVAGVRILMVEDDPLDADLICMELRRHDRTIDVVRVDSEQGLREALAKGPWNVVLSDYSMPCFDAMGTLRVMGELAPDIPVIVVSGTLGEERAVALLRSGAKDFVPKDKLARLMPAIERESREAELRAESKRLREQLMVADRMASLGMIASGVAHEINNPLMVLFASLETVQQLLCGEGASLTKLRERGLHWVESALEASERIRQIAADVRSYSRIETTVALSPVAPEKVIAASLRLAGPAIGQRTRVKQSHQARRAVLAHEGKLSQVVLNLAVNAAQAMPEGRFDENLVEVATRDLEDDRVEISVRDNGCGIPKERLSRIFDPFFTTKEKGLGLGLSICRRIIDELGGELTVESVVNQGTIFRIRLNSAPIREAGVGTDACARGPLPRSRILIIDSDPAVRAMLCTALQTSHSVAAMDDSVEAEAHLREGADYDVIMCDCMMPRFSGTALFKCVSQIRPELAPRFVFLTAVYTARDVQEELPGCTNPILQKPCDLAGIDQALHAVLDRNVKRAR